MTLRVDYDQRVIRLIKGGKKNTTIHTKIIIKKNNSNHALKQNQRKEKSTVKLNNYKN